MWSKNCINMNIDSCNGIVDILIMVPPFKLREASKVGLSTGEGGLTGGASWCLEP